MEQDIKKVLISEEEIRERVAEIGARISEDYAGKNLLMVFAYLCGTVLSALAGYVGISIATIANLKAACATHTCSVYHDRVKADNCRNLKLLCELTYKLHHDHRSDGNTHIILVASVYKLLNLICNDTLASI